MRELNLLDAASRKNLNNLFQELEPEGAKGMVQMGYTLSLPIYNFYKKKHGNWQFNQKAIEDILAQAAIINRPFVVYIAADHFFGESDYGKYLASLPESLMQFQDGSVPKEKYFQTAIIPFRISNNPNLPHIRAKITALKIIAQQLADFRKKHPNLLIAITLNGETHYLFENFFSGTGNFKNPRFTDFSPDAVNEFRTYLNKQSEYSLRAKEIKKINFEHYPWGTYPFFGWYCGNHEQEKIIIYHNGARLAPAEMQLNRMDVYEALPQLQNPNCGFRYDIDFSKWSRGTHRIEAILEYNDKQYSLDNNQLILQLGDKITPTSEPKILPNIRKINRFNPLKNKGYVDRGSNQPVLVNYIPLARHWMNFRADSIVLHQNMLGKIFSDASIPTDIIYNYQLPPFMNGDWNNELFGIGKDFFQQSNLLSGVTLYGGNTLNQELFKHIPHNKKYGIPEFHPQIEQNPYIAEQSLRFHAAQGASFISPYFMDTGDKRLNDGSGTHKQMLIEANNPHKGSNYLYKAIKKILAY